MSRKKLKRIKIAQKMPNIVNQEKAQQTKNSWSNFFNNKNPIILELACGKGEYTTNLAQTFPNKNFIGIDRKADRLFCGAKQNIPNTCFIHSKIELLNEFFEAGEISEIWITFPDPYQKSPNRRLTNETFLDIYKKILKPNGLIHLKTDSLDLFEFTLKTAKNFGAEIKEEIRDIYTQKNLDPLLQIQTNFEKKHLVKDKKIHYASWFF